MFKNLRIIISTWPFVGSLLVLLVNDAWLKYAYPGVVTGKLSDFAGIAMVGLLLLAALPHRRWIAVCAVSAGFFWWKSPLSQPMIDAINLHLATPIGRVVDYTDLLALLGIPLCLHIVSRPEAFAIPGAALRRALLVPVIASTVLGLMATSVVPLRQDYQIRRPDPAAVLDHEAVADAVAQVAARHELACVECANRTSSAVYEGNGVLLNYVFVGKNAISFQIQARPDGLFFGADPKAKADRLRADLKARLGALFKDLEYVERLGH